MTPYKLTSESREVLAGETVYKIELTEDCKWGKKGVKGGWLSSRDNLKGEAWVYGDAQVYGNARVSGNAQVYGDAQVYGNAWISGNARVSGDARVYGSQWKISPLQIQGTKHYLNESKEGYIQIGCHIHKISYWMDNFKEIGKKEGYSAKEIAEYGIYIRMFSEMNKLRSNA